MNMAVTDLKLERRVDDAPATVPAGPGPSKNPTKRKPRRMMVSITRTVVIIAAIGVVIVVPLGWGQWVSGMTDQSTDDAYLAADVTPISAQVTGRVSQVAVADYQPVKAGQVLFRIDDRDYAAHLADAKAQVAAASANVRMLGSQISLQQQVIAEAQAEVTAAQAVRDQAASDFTRAQNLTRDGWTTAQALGLAAANIKSLDAQLAEKQTVVDADRQQTSVLQAQEQQAQAELQSQQANLDLAQINLDRTIIRSPVDGVVSASDVQLGQFLPVGAQVITVVPLPHVYVLANYTENQLGNVRPGQRVTVKVDMFPGKVLSGHVVSISPATGSEFALLPADNATGNFTKVAQRLAVRVAIDDSDGLGDQLRPGMSVVPTILTDQTIASAK
ncbi:MAG TPA: HlyD family secretion protein [Devosiaceae bacterium]|nr:HlyD family secretion protein [Devosiaceae bacterium]